MLYECYLSHNEHGNQDGQDINSMFSVGVQFETFNTIPISNSNISKQFGNITFLMFFNFFR